MESIFDIFFCRPSTQANHINLQMHLLNLAEVASAPVKSTVFSYQEDDTALIEVSFKGAGFHKF